MKVNRPLSAKILVGSKGLGLPDPDLVEKRAWEVAAIQAHEIPNSADWDEAKRELHGRSTEGGVEGPLIEDPSLPPGFQPQSGNGDDPNLGEELYREGMEEAEHERMLLARAPTPDQGE